MADKSVGELIAATSVTPTDLFLLEQNGTAKKLTGQILENWLVSFADGHGGIQSIVKKSTSGLVDTYRITLSDTTTFDFLVTNGRDVRSITKTGTSGLVDTYTILYNDNTSDTLTVTNGAKGDKGDNQYVWIKYASQKPTASSHSFGDVADNWIGIYSGASETAPTDWTQYEWFQIKGEKGDTGDPARLMSSAVEYQVSDSGTIIPSGAWSSSVPVVAQGKYLWTRTTTTFNTGSSVVSYSVTRMGLDGSGTVSSVANISPDGNGNVPLTAENINALPNTGGDLTGELRMNGQTISGLNAPTANDQAANMGFVHQQVRKAAHRNLLDNSYFKNPVNQRGKPLYDANDYSIDRWNLDGTGSVAIDASGIVITPKTSANYAGLVQVIATAAGFVGKRMTFAVKTLEYGLCIYNFTFGQSGEVAFGGGAFSLIHYFETRLFIRVKEGGSRTTVEWAALYEGEYTIDTLPEYQPKGYGAELAECQRYAKKVNLAYITFVALSPTFGYAVVELSVPMLLNNPSIDVENVGTIRGGGTTITPTNISVSVAHPSQIIIRAEGSFSENTVYEWIDFSALFSADLL